MQATLLTLLAGVYTVTASALPTVTISHGAIVGTTTSIASASATVNKFLGIPFAASPPERFSPPKVAQKWSTPLNATALKPACIQEFVYPLSSQEFTEKLFNEPGPLESEDCLYLNVYAPATSTKDKAVMVWIYGGGLESGWAGAPDYDGSSFAANQDVILVNFNYRTNIFGFSNSPEIATGKQNSGFLDQRRALEWVQHNIAAFGGDKHKVTIFGESAGGWSVKQLLANPPSPLPFRAAIMESEATFSSDGAAAWETTTEHFNCSTAASPLNCMRKVNATAIKEYIEVEELVFYPVSDNITSRSNIKGTLEDKTFADVPFMLGTNSEEGRLFAIGDDNATAYVESISPGEPELQAAILAEYPADQSGYDTVAAIITDLSFRCPVAMISNIAASHNYTLHQYFFNASFPNTTPLAGLGVYHSSEIPEVFGTYPITNATSQQRELSAYMQTAWANFAKDPTTGPGWPAYTTSDKVVGNLGSDGEDGEVDIDAAEIDDVCAVYTAVIDVLGI